MGGTVWAQDAISCPQPRSAPWPRPGPGVPSRPLPGRGRELARIAEFLTRSASEGDAMVVIGEAGAGRTALLNAAASQALASGFLVLRGSAAKFEADIPYSGLHQLLTPLTSQFGKLPGPHHEALRVALRLGRGPAPDRLLVCHAVLTLARTVAARQPLLVVVDDLHWLDWATTAVLCFLARRITGIAAGFLAAERARPGGFFERTGLEELELKPLDDATAALAAADQVGVAGSAGLSLAGTRSAIR